MCRDMWDLPGDLGLIVIDELPEMIGWMKREEGVISLRCDELCTSAVPSAVK